MLNELRFLSNNNFKIAEYETMLDDIGVNVIPTNLKIEEIQSENMEVIVKDKLLKAFDNIGKPLIVEQTGLLIDYLNGFPGGLTQIFWDKLQADKFAKLVNNFPEVTLTAKTVIGYCDLKQMYFFDGEVKGKVPESPRGNKDFQWDCVFIPDGYDETFAQMGKRKNEISMRRKALNSLCEFLKVQNE